MNANSKIAIAASASLVVGAAAGYFVANKKAEMKWQAISEEEIQSVKDAYHKLENEETDDGPELTEAPVVANRGYVQRLVGLGYHEPAESGLGESNSSDPRVAPEATSEREPTTDVSNGDHRSEVVLDRTKPYIISQVEYFTEESDFDKQTVSYYEKDETLADERNEIIEDVLNTVGEKGVTSFGIDPDDPHVVYVRNHRLMVDFEILWHEGSFIEEITGTDVLNGE